MKQIILSILFFPMFCFAKELPISDGTYVFQHKYAEHPTMKSIPFNVVIIGQKITVTNNVKSNVWPTGVIDQGELFWHSSKQWIIIAESSDKMRKDVGGCSGGPAAVDLVNKIYWSC